MWNIPNTWKAIRKFLLSTNNKEFLIFLFFLVISIGFWMLSSLDETYEKELSIPVQLTNIPNNAIVTSDTKDTFKVNIRDKGFTLVRYQYGGRIHPVKIDFNKYADNNTGVCTIPVAEILKYVYAQLYSSTRVLSVKPDKFVYYFNFGSSKMVPVRLTGHITAARDYYLSKTKILPPRVKIYAQKKLLKRINYISTRGLNITNIADTVIRKVRLEEIVGVKIVPSTVQVEFYPDILTEATIEVPIKASGMPEGKVLRTFPAKARVKFIVGSQVYRNVKTDEFVVEVNYNELTEQHSDKCKLHLRSFPKEVKNAQLEFEQVDYLIENQ